MNKQELIDKLKRHLTQMSEIKGSEYCKGYEYATKHHLAMIADLDEPEKPVVPQFVADWYEEHKDNFEYSIQCLCVQGCEPVRQIDTWFDDDSNKPIETLVMMHKFGYKVKKEKLYTVELPNPNSFSLIILRRNEEGKIYISFNIPNLEKWKSDENVQLTESEIKKDFEWAWEFAEEVEE